MRACMVLALVCLCASPLLGQTKMVATCKRSGLIAITIDDGVTRNFPEILDLLDKAGAKATFFVIGETLIYPKNLKLLKDAYSRGHTIANHSWSHPYMPNLKSKQLEMEMRKTQNGINLVAPRSPLYFRPPYGTIDSLTEVQLKTMGYTSILWNIDSRDWRGRMSKDAIWQIFKRAILSADPTKQSFISLQHSRRKESMELLPDIIQLARFSGFRVVTLDECLN